MATSLRTRRILARWRNRFPTRKRPRGLATGRRPRRNRARVPLRCRLQVPPLRDSARHAHRDPSGGRTLGVGGRSWTRSGPSERSHFGPVPGSRGARLVVAPRVLVDATAVPADRGALGRYVDGLVVALCAGGADIVVACQRADEERYGRMIPSARIVAGPTAIAHRSARLAWEQTGLPLVAQQTSAGVMHIPHSTMPMRPGVPVVVTIHDLTFFTEPDAHSPVTATFYKSNI